MATVKQLLETLEDMRKVYQFDDEKTDITILGSDSLSVKTVDNETGVFINMLRNINREKREETLDENDLQKLRDTLLIWSMIAVREELLQHGDFYNGFLASIMSVLNENWNGETNEQIAEKILKRITGEE